MRPFVFALEAVPDIEALRRVLGIASSLPDGDAIDYAFQRQRALTGVDELPPHFLKIVALSCVEFPADGIRIINLASPEMDEGALLAQLAAKLDLAPGLFWNAAGRECALLKRRGLLHPGVRIPDSALIDLALALDLAPEQASSARSELAALLGAPVFRPLTPAASAQAWRAAEEQRIFSQCEALALASALIALHAHFSDEDQGFDARRGLLLDRLAELSRQIFSN